MINNNVSMAKQTPQSPAFTSKHQKSNPAKAAITGGVGGAAISTGIALQKSGTHLWTKAIESKANEAGKQITELSKDTLKELKPSIKEAFAKLPKKATAAWVAGATVIGATSALIADKLLNKNKI